MKTQHFSICIIPGKGRGLIANRPFAEGETIEESPVIVMDSEARQLLDQTLLHDYIFEWQPEGKNGCCMALGYIPLYNHACPSNCEYAMDYKAETMKIVAIRNIAEGDELTINYNGDFDNAAPLWFEAVD